MSTAKHNVARYRAATWLTADSSIDSDDITDARNFFLIIVIFVAMMMKEMYGAFDEMTKAMC